MRYESQLVEACVDSEEDCVEPELGPGQGPGAGAGQLREVPDSETIAICDTRYDQFSLKDQVQVPLIHIPVM